MAGNRIAIDLAAVQFEGKERLLTGVGGLVVSVFRYDSGIAAVRIRNAQYEKDLRPIEEGCGCYTCRHGYTRAYLKHLDHCNEMLAPILGTLHNLWHYETLMADMREAITGGTFDTFRDSFYVARNP